MNVNERREHNQHLANQLFIMKPDILFLLCDYRSKLEVDDHDRYAVDKMERATAVIERLSKLFPAD